MLEKSRQKTRSKGIFLIIGHKLHKLRKNAELFKMIDFKLKLLSERLDLFLRIFERIVVWSS